LWTAIGISPESLLIDLIGQSASNIYPDPTVRVLFILLPTVLLIISIISAYRRGKIPGLLSVVLAYFSGLLIITATVSAILLLLCAVAIGILATWRR
jgi:hypothetical protein